MWGYFICKISEDRRYIRYISREKSASTYIIPEDQIMALYAIQLVWRKATTTAMFAIADGFVTVLAGILAKPRIYAPNLGFTKQSW
jgi:hypothetical protein